MIKKLTAILILLLLISACSSNNETVTSSTASSQIKITTPVKLATIDEASLSAELKVYDSDLKLVTAKAMTIANGQVSSEEFELAKNKSYTLVIVFYYTEGSNDPVPVAYVVLSADINDSDINIPFEEEDIITDATVADTLSLDITAIGIPNLDSDGDGVSNFDEIVAGTDPNIYDETKGALSVTSFTVEPNSLYCPTQYAYALLNWKLENADHITVTDGTTTYTSTQNEFTKSFNVDATSTLESITYTLTATQDSGNSLTESITMSIDYDCDDVANADDAFPTDASESTDLDGDGVGDNTDNCIAMSNANQLDTDGDGLGDECTTELFEKEVYSNNDGKPFDVQVADFDGDGNMDFVTSSYNDDTHIRIYLGHGDFTFDEAYSIDSFTDNGVTFMDVADLNGDEKVDIVGAHRGAGNKVEIYYNNSTPGNISFTNTTFTASSASGLYQVATGDLNNDGLIDFALYDQNNKNFVVYYRDSSNPTFLSPDYLTPAIAYNPGFVTIGDADNDGYNDLVFSDAGTGSYDGNVFYYKYNKYTETLVEPETNLTTVYQGATYYYTLVTDLDDDGTNEIVTAKSNTSSPGDFDSGIYISHKAGFIDQFHVANTLYNIDAIDLDSDGHKELLATKTDQHKGINLIKGSGNDDSFFSSYQTYLNEVHFDAAVKDDRFYLTAKFADFNNDGFYDIVAAEKYKQVHVLEGKENANFKSPFTFGNERNTFRLETTDVNGDGHADVIVAPYRGCGSSTYTDNTVDIFTSDGKGNFTVYQSIESPDDGGATNIILKDVNGNGHDDLIISHDCTVIENFVYLDNYPNGFQTTASATIGPVYEMGDVNNDSYIDYASLLTSSEIKIYFGDETGLSYTESEINYTGTAITGIRFADINNDGFNDLIYTAADDTDTYINVVIRTNYGNGTFGDVQYCQVTEDKTISASDVPSNILIDDIDSDGHKDIAISFYKDDDDNGNNLVVCLNDGNGIFSGNNTINLDTTSTYSRGSLLFEDLNGDGYKDFVVNSFSKDNIHVFFGFGNGEFADSMTLDGICNAPYQSIAIDYDEDGDMDLATTCLADKGVQVFTNRLYE